MEDNQISKFDELTKLDLSDYAREKNKLKYLPWATAWSIFKRHYPKGVWYPHKTESDSLIFGNEQGGYFVYVTVDTNEEESHTMMLPIIDFRNKAILKPDVMDINKSILRCLVKAISLYGIGAQFYAGDEFFDQEIGNEKQDLIDEIIKVATVLTKAGEKDVAVSAIGHNGQPNKIKDLNEAKEVLEKLKKLELEIKTDKKGE